MTLLSGISPGVCDLQQVLSWCSPAHGRCYSHDCVTIRGCSAAPSLCRAAPGQCATGARQPRPLPPPSGNYPPPAQLPLYHCTTQQTQMHQNQHHSLPTNIRPTLAGGRNVPTLETGRGNKDVQMFCVGLEFNFQR